jgi:DNA-binding LacI/PurR family transcriptional regulator
MKRALTTKHIAKLAGVSVGTVSHVLNGSAGVSAALRKRVEDTVRKFDYQPSQLARGLRRCSTDLLGVIIPDISNPYFPRLVRGVEDVAYKEGFRLVLCNTDNDSSKELSYFNDLRSFHPAGIIVIPSERSSLATDASHRKLQTIFVDRCPDGWTGDAVMANNEDGGYQAGSYLTRMGHKLIAAISGPSHIETARDRMRGFRRALAEARVQLPSKYVTEAPFNPDGGFAAATRLLSLTPRPMAIFAANDTLAIGALAAIRALRLRCPQDVSLIGFDDLEFSEFTEPSLTTVFQPGYHIGALACQLLLDRVRGATHPAERKILNTELRIRNSVCCVLPGSKRVRNGKGA